MWSNGFAHTQAFEPGGSRALALILGLLLLVAAAAVLASPWGWPLQPGLLILLALAGGVGITRHALRRGPASWSRIERLAGGRWRLTRRDGRVVSGHIDPGSFVHPWLVIIGIRGGAWVPVPRDALDAQAHRRLRVWLRRG